MTGATISHYRIVSELGKGGMGVVYKATDTKLGRTVALKLLAPHMLASESDRSRFYREARAAAALHHPNIATVFEIDETEDGRPFIAMEYIEGAQLDEGLSEKPLPIPKAVEIATQIAEALKAAHERGVVHRDIKSANVMLTKDGIAKVLDFGLAKTDASTKLTQMGATVGTIAYMSPEQARGEEVDHRTDLWSLGAVLYEMLTGQLPFPGAYEQAVVYGILNADPEPATGLRTALPSALEQVIDKCLRKDRGMRYQSAEGVMADLRAVDGQGSSKIVPSAPPARGRSRVRGTIVGVSVGAVAALAAVAFWFLIREPEPTVVSQVFPIQLPHQGQPLTARWTPDDSGFFYMARDSADSWVQYYDIQAGESTRIPDTEGATGLELSQNGRWMIYRAEDETTYRMRIGGTPAPIPGVFGLALGVLNDGSAIVHVRGTRSIVAVDTEGKADTLRYFKSPFLPVFETENGRQFWADLIDNVSATWDASSGVVSTVAEGPWIKGVSRAGVGVFLQNGTINFGRINLKTGELEGGLTPFKSGTQPWISPGGHLLYSTREDAADSTPAQHPIAILTGSQRRVVGETEGQVLTLDASPDGAQMVASVRYTDQEDRRLVLVDLGSGQETLLPIPGDLANPQWSADGEWVYFDRGRNSGRSHLARVRTGNWQDVEVVLEDEVPLRGPAPGPDGRLLAYTRVGPRSETFTDVRIRDMVTGEDWAVANSDGGESQPVFSNDGSLIAYYLSNSIVVSDPLGLSRTFVTRSKEDGLAAFPEWSRDDRFLYYRGVGRQVARRPVSIERAPILLKDEESPRELAKLTVLGGEQIVAEAGMRFALLPDGGIVAAWDDHSASSMATHRSWVHLNFDEFAQSMSGSHR